MRVAVLSVAICGCSILLFLPACTENTDGRGEFTIAYSYDTSGQLEPCGCSAHQLGGLARRATLISDLRQSGEILVLEGGHIFEDEGSFHLFKGEIIIKALNSMNYDAMMLGTREAQQGSSGILQLEQTASFPLFSANLMLSDQPWPTRYTAVEKSGKRVAITGVSLPGPNDSQLADGAWFSPPEDALSSVLAALEDTADLVIVCLEGDTEWVRKVTQEFSGKADIFLSGDRSLDAHELAKTAAVEGTATSWELPNLAYETAPPWLNSWGLGRYLGIVAVKPRGQGFEFSGENLGIKDALPQDERIKQYIEEDFKPQLQRFFADFVVEVVQDYIPPERCGGCHPEELEVFLATSHSISLETLEQSGQAYNPDCMKCHIVYDQEEDALHGMNCILCHTNITFQHEWQAPDQMIVIPDIPPASYSYEFCVKCHDPLNSIPFTQHWPQYVNLIYHGGNLTEAQKAAKALGIEIDELPPDITRATVSMRQR